MVRMQMIFAFAIGQSSAFMIVNISQNAICLLKYTLLICQIYRNCEIYLHSYTIKNILEHSFEKVGSWVAQNFKVMFLEKYQ